jgi:hypothetical protein
MEQWDQEKFDHEQEKQMDRLNADLAQKNKERERNREDYRFDKEERRRWRKERKRTN